jgi:DHA2 family multidrug resistance protein
MNTSAKVSLLSISARQWLILLTVQLSSLLFGMTITLANVVLPKVRGALSATQDEIAWVITLNLVATAIATPMTGWLASRLGWRGVMLGGVGGFTACSFLCGIANSLEELVLYRVGQGLCGALIMPMGQAIVLATFPRELHATVMVIWGFGSVVGPVVGPVLGSVIAEIYDWRAVFFMIVPPGLLAMAFVWFALLDRNFAIGLLIAFFMGMLAFTSLVLFPGLLHDLRGYPDSAIGELLAARGIGNWVAFLVVVPISRRFPRLTVACGLSAQASAGWAMAQLDINLSSFDVFWTNALQGFGFGLAFTPMTVLAFSTLRAHQITEASGVFTLVRNFGSSLFISVSIVLLVRSTAGNYARLTEFINPYNRALAFPGMPQAWDWGRQPASCVSPTRSSVRPA